MLKLHKPSKRQAKLYAQRGGLGLIVAVMAFTAAQPSYVMSLFNFINPPEVQRQNVAPLETEGNELEAQPTRELLGPRSLDSTARTSYDESDRKPLKELTNLRNSHSKTFLNEDGTKTMEITTRQQHFKESGSWKNINNKLQLNDDSGWTSFEGEAGVIDARFKVLSEGLVVNAEGKTITMKPVGAANVTPVLKEDNVVVYKDAWPNVDLEYELRGESIKEIIVVKSNDAPTTFNFSVSGGTVIPHSSREGELTIEGLPEEYSFSAVTLDVNGRGVISEQRATQVPTQNGIKISLDSDWFASQPNSAFPMRIDPTLTRQGDSAMNYKIYKSDGYYCTSSNCYANTGSIDDGTGFKSWRSYINFSYSALQNKTVLNADLYGWYKTGVGGSSTTRSITMGLASCSTGFSCAGSTAGTDSSVSTNFNLDFTAKLKALVDADDYSSWWSVRGVESGSTLTYKPYYDMRATITYDTPTPMASAVSPANKATVVNTQPSLRVNTVTDADGDDVKYYFRVATNPDAQTGAVINSGWIDASQWTVPDHILQDGRTYYWKVYTKGYAQTNPNWIRSFKVDMRTGKDSTQAYEELGPINVDLATGNATTSTGSHSISALGGDIGVSLDYNSPAMSRPGLVAEYWNNTSFSGEPVLERVDPSIDFTWANGSPSAGVVNVDSFSSRWSGYITAPSTGDYEFGCSADNWCKIYFDDQLYYSGSTGTTYSTTPKHLEAGQPVKLKVEHAEGTSTATMQLKVKGAISERVVPESWLNTGARQTATQYGLEGRYYKAGTGGAFPSDPNDPDTLLMVRNDNKLNFDWGEGAASPGLPSDSFVIRWKGYITAPTSGSYTLGVNGMVGARIKTGTGNQVILDSWSGTPDDRWASAITLTAGEPVPVIIEAYEGSAEANFTLLIKGNGLTAQEIPVTWLAPNANILPNGWELGFGDGAVSYERLKVSSNTAILSDSTGQTYEYTWKNNGYVPPKNMEAVLTRNADNTHTVLDTDGKTYIFNAAGKLVSMNSPEDDKQPAALKYEYGGTPSKLIKVIDGVNSARYGTLHYAGDSECETLSGFDAAPSGMLCAFKTTDNKKTTFQYKSGNLARVAQPGDEFEDYSYDGFGRIVSYRDSLANDAIAYGVRDNNAEVTSEVTYDGLGRAEKVKAPAPTPGANRVETTLDYLTGSTEMHVTGASEPHGFSRKISYDALFRTTSETDLANLTSITEWHPDKDLVRSSTDPTGLKSTTIYNEDDLPVDSYGPAPASWFGSDNKPLADKVNDVPHVRTGYDEGITGLGVAYYDNKKLLRAPKLNDTVTWQTNENVIINFANGSAPVTPTDGWSARYTGKVKLNAIGDYTLKVKGDAGFRLYVDDQLYVDGWGDGNKSSTVSTVTGAEFNNTVAGSTHRIRVDHYHNASGSTSLQLYLAGPSMAETSVLSGLLSPNYGLTTSTTAYDNQVGDTLAKTVFSEPEYGQIEKTVLDPDNLNYESLASYEQQGQGFLRQTSSTLPGGSATHYEYYSATDTRDNPCTEETEEFLQAGMLKSKTEPDPDGAGEQAGRKSEVIYNDSGAIVAAHYNDEPWVCAVSDDRGRTVETVIPAVGGKAGRTITNNFAVGGNPLVVSTADGSGTITVENDLLNRTVKYTDAKGKVTTNTYDTYSKLTSRDSVVGEETYIYNNLDQLIEYKLDGASFTTITYDQYGRVSNVDYPSGVVLSEVKRDALQRENKVAYTLGDNSEIYDSVEYSTGGNILSGNENGISKSYLYDSADRLTRAIIGENEYEYEFGSSDASCNNVTNNNINASKNGNRTKFTLNGQSTTYCYDQADRLLKSSNQAFDAPEYDSRGNTITLGLSNQKTQFDFDASERNTSVTETLAPNTGSNNTSQPLVRKAEYARDVQGRIIERTIKKNGVIQDNTHFVFTGAGDAPDAVLDSNGNVIQKYLLLPGNVLAAIKPQSTSAGALTLSIPNIHGDVMATVNADGALIGKYITGPFGEKVAENRPENTTREASWQYVGQHQKLSESAFSLEPMQMGARVYVPLLGRFLSVDPIQGGTDNNYVYTNNPVTESDLSGNIIETIGDIGSIGYDSYQLAKNPSWGNLGMLAWSVGAAVVPGVPGSYVGRAGTAAIKGTNTVKKGGGSTKNVPKSTSKSPTPTSKPPASKPPTNKPPQNKSQKNFKKNYVRVNKNRMSIGHAPAHYKKLTFIQKLLNPIHIHMERKKVWIDLNWLGKGFGLRW